MSDARPHMPRGLRRDVLVEAGHRCAIPTCHKTPAVVAHIVPWAEVKTYEFANLIALCPTCHARYDNTKEIDRKSMFRYKANLALLNSRHGDTERRAPEYFSLNPQQSTISLTKEPEWLTSSTLRMIDQRANRHKNRIFRVEPIGLGQAMGDSYIVTRDRKLPNAAGTRPGDTLRFQVRARDHSGNNDPLYVHRIHCDGHLADWLANQELTLGIRPLDAALEGSLSLLLECRGTYNEMSTGIINEDTPKRERNTIWRLVSIQGVG